MIELIHGDARHLPLADESVQTCITSPPYFGLRDYGTAQWEGGSTECDHRAPNERRQLPHGDGRAYDCYTEQRVSIVGAGAMFRDVCGKCGATRIDRQIGLEGTPQEYISNLVAVFREVHRVLRDDGTVWLNLGDSYSQGGGAQVLQTKNASHGLEGMRGQTPGVAPKNLLMIPARVAIALQDDGWYLRSDIIWSKPNPMPESVTDRPTKAHEYIFLLSKSPKYYYGAEAIREPACEPNRKRGDFIGHTQRALASRPIDRKAQQQTHRNKRSVWEVATQPYSEAHFATFPPKLIEPCVLAGAPVGAVVLDPFSGAGTTGIVAIQHQRSFVGVELSVEYIAIAQRRIAAAQQQPALALA